jgi:hypothetical protein
VIFFEFVKCKLSTSGSEMPCKDSFCMECHIPKSTLKKNQVCIFPEKNQVCKLYLYRLISVLFLHVYSFVKCYMCCIFECCKYQHTPSFYSFSVSCSVMREYLVLNLPVLFKLELCTWESWMVNLMSRNSCIFLHRKNTFSIEIQYMHDIIANLACRCH